MAVIRILVLITVVLSLGETEQLPLSSGAGTPDCLAPADHKQTACHAQVTPSVILTADPVVLPTLASKPYLTPTWHQATVIVRGAHWYSHSGSSPPALA